MFPRAVPQSQLPTPAILAVVQDQDNFLVTYSRGLTQSHEYILTEFLVDDVVVKSFLISPQPVLVNVPNDTEDFPGYTQGAEVKVRLSNSIETKTSAPFTTTYTRLEGLPTIPQVGSFAIRDGITPGQYEWGFDISPYPILSTDGYYNIQVIVTLEARSFPSGVFSLIGTRFFSVPADANLWFNSPNYDDGPTIVAPDEIRVTVTITAAGYSTSLSELNSSS